MGQLARREGLTVIGSVGTEEKMDNLYNLDLKLFLGRFFFSV